MSELLVGIIGSVGGPPLVGARSSSGSATTACIRWFRTSPRSPRRFGGRASSRRSTSASREVGGHEREAPVADVMMRRHRVQATEEGIMPEKSADLRHLQHDEFERKLRDLDKENDEARESFSNFITRQADEFANFRIEFLNEIRGIERAIASKCEQDSAIIATQNREVQRLDRVEGSGTDTAKALAVVAQMMKDLREDTDKSLGAAHEKIRGHGMRIEKLEHRAGKLALKVLVGAVGAAGVAAITAVVTKAFA